MKCTKEVTRCSGSEIVVIFKPIKIVLVAARSSVSSPAGCEAGPGGLSQAGRGGGLLRP